jgi:hypothetical protein
MRLPNRTTLLLAFTIACSRSNRDDANTPMLTSTPSSDIAALAQRVRLPVGVSAARWFVRARRPPGSRLVPGPTDTVLIAYVTLTPSGWAAAAPLIKQLEPVTKRISVEDARALLPPATLSSLPTDGMRVELTGIPLDLSPLDTAIYHPSAGLRIGDGFFASFYTR